MPAIPGAIPLIVNSYNNSYSSYQLFESSGYNGCQEQGRIRARWAGQEWNESSDILPFICILKRVSETNVTNPLPACWLVVPLRGRDNSGRGNALLMFLFMLHLLLKFLK